MAEDVLKKRYYQPGEVDFDDVCKRVVYHVYPQDKSKRDACTELMKDMRFLPNSPTLMNSGTDIGQLSACFALGIEDNMVSIFDTLKNAALIFKSGGGVGINFSYLRPKGSSVGSTLGTSSGVISFMQVYNSMVETVKSGAVRRGAAIGILNIDHPEIEDFVTSKNVEGQLSNFNISVLITDQFMRAVELGDPWYLKFDGKVCKEIDARQLFGKIAESMWTRAEPGILYHDIINSENPLINVYGLIDTVNPCGEKTLVVMRNKESEYNSGGSSCNLGSLNLSKYVDKDGKFMFEIFKHDIKLAVQFLDSVIDVNKYPLESIEYITKDIREIGLGVMGYHDMLIKIGISYDSEQAYKFESELFSVLYMEAVKESEHLGGVYGSFPCCDKSSLTSPRRNSFVLAIAPTGTLSLLANCSSGIEPNFSYVYDRTTTSSGEKKKYREVHPLFESYMQSVHPNRYDAIVEHMMRFGTVQNCSYLNDDDKNLFKTAKDIHWKDHIKTQSIAQRWVDSSISKTINMSNSATVEDMKSAMVEGWKSGLKGFCVYREGSRSDVVLETNATKQIDEKKEPITIPREIDLKSIRMNSACGVLWVQTGFDKGSSKPVEVWVKAEKGGCEGNLNYIGRLISKMLQEGISHEVACRQGDKVFCSACVNNLKGEAEGYSCANLISKGIKEGIKKREDDITDTKPNQEGIENISLPFSVRVEDDICPDCGAKLIHTDGCKSCTCGYTRCR
jgi:ribonucleoside-diphosphate reductase alpha chain